MYQKYIKNNTKIKFRKVLTSDFKTISYNINSLLTYLEENFLTKTIIDTLKLNPNYGAEWHYKQLGSMVGAVDLNLPETDEDLAALSLKLLEKYSDDNRGLNILCRHLNQKDPLNYFNNVFTKHLMEYIDNKIEEGNVILYILNKYKLYCEWFKKEELMKLYNNNSSRGEELLTKDLREFLFNQGIDFPFSEPNTPSGRPDLIYGINTDNPLTLEVKLFGGKGHYGKDYIKKGFKQAYHYTKDYNKNFGYLLIFNLSENILEFNLSNISSNLHIEYGNKTIFLVVVDLNINKSASQNRDLEKIIIDEEFLVYKEEK